MTNAEQDIKIVQTKQEVDDFKAIIENFIGEMRDRDNKRDADIKEIRKQREADNAKYEADMKELRRQREADNAKYEADMKELRKQREADNAKYEATANELRTEIRDGIKHIQNLTVAGIIGFLAIAVAVIAFVWQNVSNNQMQANYQPPPAQIQNYSPPQNPNYSGGD